MSVAREVPQEELRGVEEYDFKSDVCQLNVSVEKFTL